MGGTLTLDTDSASPVFLGVDLGWYGKPSGLASIGYQDRQLCLLAMERLETSDEILDWIGRQAGAGTAVAGVDAPLVITNQTGIREAERALNRDLRRYDAGCHAANLGRPFAANVLAFSRRLQELGFRHGAQLEPRQPGRFQIEVHPHGAAVRFFNLPRIVKYKRGTRDERARELRRLRRLIVTHLSQLDPPLALRLPPVPRTGSTKPVEDRIDAVLCAYIAAHWWHWGTLRNRLYGTEESGYIVVPEPVAAVTAAR